MVLSGSADYPPQSVIELRLKFFASSAKPLIADIVRIGRGIWGLKERYPHRNWKKEKEAAKYEESDKGEEADVMY